MYLFDTSALISAWDIYPESIDLFLHFWEWFGEQVSAGNFVISDTGYNELKTPSQELKKWIDSRSIQRLEVNQDVLVCAAKIEEQWIGDGDYGKGAGPEDLKIISAAKIYDCTLVSGEAMQPNLSEIKNKNKYKIPTLCSMPYVGVKCISLNELIKQEA